MHTDLNEHTRTVPSPRKSVLICARLLTGPWLRPLSIHSPFNVPEDHKGEIVLEERAVGRDDRENLWVRQFPLRLSALAPHNSPLSPPTSFLIPFLACFTHTRSIPCRGPWSEMWHVAVLLLGLLGLPASAQAQFYSGKTIDILIWIYANF